MSGLVLAIAGLAFINVTFAAVVVLLRIRNVRRAARLDDRRPRWYPRIIEVISDDSDTQGLSELVAPNEQRDVVEISWDVARRLRGSDRSRVQRFAAPLLDVTMPDLEARRPETRAVASGEALPSRRSLGSWMIRRRWYPWWLLAHCVSQIERSGFERFSIASSGMKPGARPSQRKCSRPSARGLLPI